MAKSSNVLLENMTDPITRFSDKATHSPFQRAFEHDLMIYDWYELPEQQYRRRRFGTAMAGLAALRGDAILNGMNVSTSTPTLNQYDNNRIQLEGDPCRLRCCGCGRRDWDDRQIHQSTCATPPNHCSRQARRCRGWNEGTFHRPLHI